MQQTAVNPLQLRRQVEAEFLQYAASYAPPERGLDAESYVLDKEEGNQRANRGIHRTFAKSRARR